MTLTFDHVTDLGAILARVCVPKMADPSREEEQVTLLGEEGLMAGGQALKLGYDQIDYRRPSMRFDFLLRWGRLLGLLALSSFGHSLVSLAVLVWTEVKAYPRALIMFCSACTVTLIRESTDHHSGKHWSRPVYSISST